MAALSEIIMKISLVFVLLLVPVFVKAESAITCHADIIENSAVFLIDNPLGDDDWEWNSSNTPDNSMEYRWKVRLGKGTLPNQCNWSKYEFGLSHFKFPNSKAGKGTLQELLRSSYATVWETHYENNSSSSSVISGNVKVGVYENQILLGTQDADTINLLFTDKPNLAEISAFLPGKDIEYSCITEINYY